MSTVSFLFLFVLVIPHLKIFNTDDWKLKSPPTTKKPPVKLIWTTSSKKVSCQVFGAYIIVKVTLWVYKGTVKHTYSISIQGLLTVIWGVKHFLIGELIRRRWLYTWYGKQGQEDIVEGVSCRINIWLVWERGRDLKHVAWKMAICLWHFLSSPEFIWQANY